MQGDDDEGSSAPGSKRCSRSSNKSQDNTTGQQQPENNKSNPTVVHKIINITAESLSQTQAEVSIVDPWVPRIANNDEYLQLGLDFSVGGGSADTQDDAVKDATISPFVGDIGAERLGSALSNNNLLLYLNLSNNRIGVEGGIVLAHALYTGNLSRSALQRFDLSKNCISDEGSIAFKEALLYNQTLEELNISENGIGINGVVALLEGLQHNDATKILRISNNLNSIVDSEMKRLVNITCDVLKKNSSDQNGGRLEMLEMGSNGDLVDDGISDVHSSTLMHAMSCFDARNIKERVNHRFRRLTLPTNEIRGHKNQLSSLQTLLGFNSFYRPIMELHDIIRANTTENDASEPLKAIPTYLQRDADTRVLNGLLPLTLTSSSTLSVGIDIDYKLMPRVMAFATRQCTLETVFNLIRYRPDMFFCIHSGRGAVGCCSPNGCCIL